MMQVDEDRLRIIENKQHDSIPLSWEEGEWLLQQIGWLREAPEAIRRACVDLQNEHCDIHCANGCHVECCVNASNALYAPSPPNFCGICEDGGTWPHACPKRKNLTVPKYSCKVLDKDPAMLKIKPTILNN